MFHHAAARESARIAHGQRCCTGTSATCREIPNVECVERDERQTLTIWRRFRAANLRDSKDGVIHCVFEFRQRAHLLVDIGSERDCADAPRWNIDAPNLAVIAGDERLRIGGKRRARIHITIVDAAALRIVALHIHDQPPFIAGRQIAQLERFE